MNRKERMLESVGWANERIARLGLEDAVAVVYTRGSARLLNALGRELLALEGDALSGCCLLVARLEGALARCLEREFQERACRRCGRADCDSKQ